MHSRREIDITGNSPSPSSISTPQLRPSESRNIETLRSAGPPMSSEPHIGTIERLAAVDGDAIHPPGRENVPESTTSASIDSVPQATDNGANLHDNDIILEQRMPEWGPEYEPSQGNARANSRKSRISAHDLPLPKLSDPLKTQIPKPDGDPFEYFLKPMLEKDSIQCNAWKDEVQNILIFAGLFSAVVTAFIIESYQRLQPDPNDAIIGILAHIAERLDNQSINGSLSAAPIVSTTNFAPSRSDISINIFWFISLILSLTAALIGIITLQWLREHQRYDSTLKPMETMAILHMRLDSLKRWYVPQIFAGLPLLLQSALVLFFGGMIQFLFALRPEVAVPVTLSICIPLLFLMTTTILPTLQVCILQDPFRLSINNNVPSPCPYKSPQSLIARRIGTAFQIVPKYFAFVLVGAYECIIPIVSVLQKLPVQRFMRKLFRRPPRFIWPVDPPIFRAQKVNLRARLRDGYPQTICKIIRARSSDWESIDTSWLKVRTAYAVSLQMANRNSDDLDFERDLDDFQETSLPPSVYDCTRSFHDIRRQSFTRGDMDKKFLCHCVEALCAQAMNTIGRLAFWHVTDFSYALGRFLVDVDFTYSVSTESSDGPVTAAFIKDILLDTHSESNYVQSSVLETLGTALIAFWVHTSYWSEPVTFDIRVELATRLTMNRLQIDPEKLFAMSRGDTWLPLFASDQAISQGSHSKSATDLLLMFLTACSELEPKSHIILFRGPTAMSYSGIIAYMNVVVIIQGEDRIVNTLDYLTQLCNSNVQPNLLQEKPFLLIAACIYLATAAERRRNCNLPRLKLLGNIILDACGLTERGDSSFSPYGDWDQLDDVMTSIYSCHGSSHYPTRNSDSHTSSVYERWFAHSIS